MRCCLGGEYGIRAACTSAVAARPRHHDGVENSSLRGYFGAETLPIAGVTIWLERPGPASLG
jgi:hypothetical protein